MANNDALWFEMGVRDNVSKTISDILQKAEDLQDLMESLTLGRNAVKNASDFEQALDKIAVARRRISEAKLVATDKDDIDNLKKMDKEIAKVQKRFEGIASMPNDTAKAMMGTKGMAKYMEMLAGLPLALDQIRRKTSEVTEQAIADARAKEAEANRVDALKSKYYELYHIRKQLQDAIMSAAPGVDITQATSMLNSVTARMGAIRNAQNSGKGMPSSVTGADAEDFFRRVKDQTRSLTSATDEYNKRLSTTEDIQANLRRLVFDTDSQQRIALIRKQTTEYTALGQKLKEIEDLERRVAAERKGVENGTVSKPTYTRNAVNAELDNIQRRYNEAIARGKQLEREDAEAKKQRADASRKTADAVQMLAHANQGLISSYNRIAQAGRQANNVTIQLQHQVGQFASLYGVERILRSVVTIGGQFEVQHVALQNILGDVQKANVLFSQLQDLAVESPKTFMELTAYTKQLSAYQIPANELFETTKRLADMSSGLGVDMSRLILAYGQVRSAAVLRGQELRQFTEAGIPLVQKLAEEFTKLNGKVVTTGEVFELISKRAVPFEMVKKILWDMTSEGGQFYNMQSELADTLYGKWQKLQDQWQITLGHIAEGNSLSGKFLKTALEYIVALTSAFDTLLPMLGMFGVGRAGVSIFKGLNRVINESNGTTAIKKMQDAKEQEANRLTRERLMYGKMLTAEEQRIVNERGKLVSQDYYLLAAENKITAKKAHQLMLDGKMSKEHFYRLLQMQGYTREQRKQIALGNLRSLQGGSTLGKLGKGALGFMGGWIGVAMTAIGGVMALYGNAASKAEEASNLAKGASDSLLGDLKNVNTLYNELTKNAPTKTEDITAAIGRMSAALKNTGGYTEELQQKLSGITDDREKYALLYVELEKVSGKYLKMKENVEAYLEAAARVGEGNWFTKMFNDPMSEDLKQLSSANLEKKVAKAQADRYGAALREALIQYAEHIGEDPVALGFTKASWNNIFKVQNEDWRSGFENWLSYKVGSDNRRIQYWTALLEVVESYNTAINNALSKEQEVDGQMSKSVEYYKMALEERASLNNLDVGNLVNWNEADLRKFDGWLNDIVGSMSLDSETAEKVHNAILDAFPKEAVVKIKALPALNSDDLAPWQNDLDKYFKSHKINLPITAQTSLEQVEKKLQDKKKEFQEQMDRGGSILLRLGLDLSKLPKTFDEIRPLVPVWMQNLAEKGFIDYTEGKAGVASMDQTGKDTGLNTEKKTKTSGGTKSGGTKKDSALEKAKTELDEIKKFYAEYKKYREVYGPEKGQSLVEEIFGMEKGGGSDIINNYRKKLNSILSGLALNTEQRKKFAQSVKQAVADINLDEEKQKLSRELDELQEYLSRQTGQWNLYKQLMDKTGNREFAMQAFNDGKVWTDLSRQFADDLKTAVEEAGSKMPDNVWDMTDAAAKEHFKDVKDGYVTWKKVVELVRDDYKKSLEEVSGIMERLTSWEEKIADVEDKLAKARKEYGANSPQAIMRERQLQETKDKAFENSEDYVRFYNAILTMTIDQAEEIGLKIRENLDKSLQKGTKSAKQYQQAIKQIDEQLKKIREQKNGLVTFLNGGLNSVFQSQYDKAENSFNNAADAMEKASELYDQARYKYGVAEKKNDTAGMQAAQNSMDAAQGMMQSAGAMKDGAAAAMKGAQGNMTTLAIIDKIIHGINDMVQSVKQSFEEIRTAMQNMGSDTNTDSWNEWGTFFNSFASASNSATNGWDSLKNGNIGGAISGTIGSFTGWINGIADGWNKKKDEEIKYAQQQLSVTEQMRDVLEKNLERTLGGVYNYKTSQKNLERLLEARNKTEEVDEKTYEERAKKSILSGLAGSSIGFAAGGGAGPIGALAGGVIGGVIGNLLGARTNAYTVNYYNEDTIKQMDKAIKSQTYYDEQLALLYKQRDEIQHQWQSEYESKDTDEDKLRDYEKQINELQDQIKYFAEDMAKALYDIDVKSWASELGDALFDAWQKGKDGAEAFGKKASGILGTMVKNIAAKKIIETAMQPMLDTITSEMERTTGMLDEDSITAIAEKMNLLADTLPETYANFMDKMDMVLKEKGIDIKDTDNSSSSGSTIGKTITEQDTTLWTSYLNAIRADVSVSRATLVQILEVIKNEGQMPVIAEAQLNELRSIVANTKRNADAAEMIYELLHRLSPDGTSIKVR